MTISKMDAQAENTNNLSNTALTSKIKYIQRLKQWLQKDICLL